jgi:hypothetical protein
MADTLARAYEAAAGAEGVAGIAAALEASGSTAEGGLVLDLRGTALALAAARHRLRDADIVHIAEAIRAAGGAAAPIVELHLGCNRLTDGALAPLLDALEAGSGGEEEVGGAGAAIATPLAVLSLADNELSGAGAAALAARLARVAPYLRTLVVDGNAALGDEGAASLAALLESHPSLAALCVARCGVGPEGLIALSGAIARSAVLAHLDLSEPALFSRNEETTHHIARALRSNASLTSLILRKHRHMSDTSVEVLVDSLLDNASLLALDLSANHLGPPSAETLAKAIRAGLPCRSLSLAFCRVADPGAVALAAALGVGGVELASLDLRHNDIGDEGLTALANALLSPACPLLELRLAGNRLAPGARGVEALAAALRGGAVRARVDLRP